MEPHGRENIFIIALFVLVSIVFSVAATKNSCKFPAIYNFGDSNSDTGNMAAAFGPLLPPNGKSYFGGPAGRYCDGRLIIDFLAESLGLPYLRPVLDALGSNFSQGANFASAGATIRPPTLPQSSGISPMSLDIQHAEFNNFHKKSQIIRKKGGVFAELMPKPEDFSRALYTFDIGQNDISGGFNRFLYNMTADQVKAIVPYLIDQLIAPIKDMYYQGGRFFWIHNTGPFGCSPQALETYLITAGQIDEVGCVNTYNEVAQLFNRKLKEAVVQLRKELPEAALTYVDVYSAKYDLISRAKRYGFEQPLTACCGFGGKYKYGVYFCGQTVKIHDKEFTVGSCEDPSVMVNWDGIHYTQAANKLIADIIRDGFYSDPPNPVDMACHREWYKSLVTPN